MFGSFEDVPEKKSINKLLNYLNEVIKQGHQPSKDFVSRVSNYQAFVPGKAWCRKVKP